MGQGPSKAASSEPRSSGFTLSLYIEDKQLTYDQGDRIRGELVVDIERDGVTISRPTVAIICQEKAQKWLTNELSATHMTFVSEFGSIYSTVGCHRFPFDVKLPLSSIPSASLDNMGEPDSGIFWYVKGAVMFTDTRHPSPSERLATSLARINFSPSPTGAELAEHLSLLEGGKSITLRKGLSMIVKGSSTLLPEAPHLCHLTIDIIPCTPVFVESVEVYLETVVLLRRGVKTRTLVSRDYMAKYVCNAILEKPFIFSGLRLTRHHSSSFQSRTMALWHDLVVLVKATDSLSYSWPIRGFLSPDLDNCLAIQKMRRRQTANNIISA